MSVVFSVRIPRELKERMERLRVNWGEEVRKFLEKRVEEEEMRELMRRLREYREKMRGRSLTPSETLIREEREGR